MAKRKPVNHVQLAEKMRQSVLQAAIEGKLTKQDTGKDGDARDLLVKVEAEKKRLVEAGEIKRHKALPEIKDDEIPFDIPDNWVWVRLGKVVNVNPRNKADDNTDAAFVPMRMMNGGYNNSFVFEIRKWKSIKKGYTHFSKNDIVFAKITPCFQNRKSAIIKNIPNNIGAGTTEFHVLRSYSDSIVLGCVVIRFSTKGTNSEFEPQQGNYQNV